MGQSGSDRKHGVDEDMITENEIRIITEKYAYYLKHSYTDIALSKSGKAYFVEFDKMGECNTFYIAEKSDQLEQLIKANICENMECIMDVAVEDMEYQLRRYELDEIEPLTEKDYEEKLRILIEKLDIVYKSIRKVYGEVLDGKGI